MTTSIASDKSVRGAAAGDMFDPFVSSPAGHAQSHLRHASFDTSLFSLAPGTSAEQVKRAIEAHLRDTERRMEEAGKLGTALVQQQRELTEKLREVEQLQSESELNPELRQRLTEIERDYNEVARESARALLPKQRVPSNEAPPTPFMPEGKGGRRSVSPSKFEVLATASPTKLNVPNRKLRNQPANRIHDIEFAAEISTSLITQVRNLQALLAEREEELRKVKVDRSRLELEAEGIQQRIKSLDESENRYKDENWNLETQIHELLSGQKEASEREKKLTQNLNLLQAEKNATQRDLDEVKEKLTKQDEKHSAVIKALEIELGTSRRNTAIAESERAAMQKKVDELTSQNQELARAFSIQRVRLASGEGAAGPSEEEFQTATDNGTPDHSPPPSPVKGTPRHSALESETLKTSLAHAQRTIQTLRTNIHREKTEKLELKRMLQDARDELEKARSDPNPPAPRRGRKTESREFKRPRPTQLGGPRSSRTELVVEDIDRDPEWEDQSDVPSPRTLSHAGSTLRLKGSFAPIHESGDDQFETANETSDAAFETAHERGTETEDFQTGAEEFSEDGSDAMTETESPSKGSGRLKRPPILAPVQSGGRYSFDSTASTSNDEDDYGFHGEARTPTSLPIQKTRLRMSRSGLSRRSRQFSEEPTLQSSPASYAVHSVAGTPQQGGQSLFAELGDFEGSDDESVVGRATPSRRSIRSVTPASVARGRLSPPPEVPALPRAIMVDSGMMTEPVEVRPLSHMASVPEELRYLRDEDEQGSSSPHSVVFRERPMSMQSVIGPRRSFASAHWLGDEVKEEDMSRPVSTISYSDASVQHDSDMEAKLSQFPSPPTSPPKSGFVPNYILPPPQKLSVSRIKAEHIEPLVEPDIPSSPPSLSMSSILSEHTEPIILPETLPEPPLLSLSSLVSQDVEPQAEPELPAPVLSTPIILSQEVEPVSEVPPSPAALSFSTICAEQVEPLEEPEPAPPSPVALSFAPVLAEEVQPIAEPESTPPSPVVLSVAPISTQQFEPVELPEPEIEVRAVPVVDVPAQVAEPLSFSGVLTQEVEPRSELPASPSQLSFSVIGTEELSPRPEPEVPVPELTFTLVQAQDLEPVERPQTPPPALSLAAIHSQVVEPIATPEPEPAPLTLSLVQSQEVEPSVPEEPTPIVPTLSIIPVQALESEPVEPFSPKRNAFIIPRDVDLSRPQTPAGSQHKELEPAVDQAAQTTLTSQALDEILNARPLALGNLGRSDSAASIGTPSTVRIHRPRQESIDSPPRNKGKPAYVAATTMTAVERPGSAASGKTSLHGDVPPLPANHKEVIKAARTGSSSGGQGTIGSMPPPLFPASALKGQNASARPRTPNSIRRPLSPISVASGRGTPTPRAVAAKSSSAQGASDMHSLSRLTSHSRKSSVSSFTSEIETRFNMHHEGGFEGLSHNTDPRMIQAITQTMIGEYLWKYTRKTGRGELSENRHRRYFWLHPYTRTLYWSDRDPSTAGRAELRAKSVPIEAVRVVADDNPMPPGLHRKSLVVISPGRAIKFTCTTGQRHETWFNALSYLLLRTTEEGQTDAEDMAGSITREDVDEFNPSYGRRPANGTRVAPSLSSYNSRTVRESPTIDMTMSLPTLTPTSRSKMSQSRTSFGGLTRISDYWKDSKVLSGTFGSLRSRSVSGRDPGQSIYEASEVPDSAEDVRQIIERQERESDRLENVRACCDGKHDVGTLTKSATRGRHLRPPIQTHGSPSTTPTPSGTIRSRV